MAEFDLKNNIFEFKQQVAGAAISTKFAHPYACIYMDELEAEFLKKRRNNCSHLYGFNIQMIYFLYEIIVRMNLKSDCHFVICLIESPIKMMKNVFYFVLKAFFVLNIIHFSHVILIMQEKQLDLKDKANFKIHDVTTWFTNNSNTHIAQYLTK